MKKSLLTGENREPMTGLQAANNELNALSYLPFSPPGHPNQKRISEHAVSLETTAGELVSESSDSRLHKTAADEQEQKSKIWFIGFRRGKNIRNAAAVFIFLVLCTFFLKKIVDRLVEKTFPVEHKATVISNLKHKEKVAGREYQNALVTVIVPSQAKVKKQLPRPARIQDIKKQVTIKGTGYTVGYFGGISGLKLTVSNKSRHLINQVELEINYLKQNGDVIETSTYQLRYIGAHTSQTLRVPPSQKGVRVRYKIMNIYARQYPLLKEI